MVPWDPVAAVRASPPPTRSPLSASLCFSPLQTDSLLFPRIHGGMSSLEASPAFPLTIPVPKRWFLLLIPVAKSLGNNSVLFWVIPGARIDCSRELCGKLLAGPDPSSQWQPGRKTAALPKLQDRPQRKGWKCYHRIDSCID